MPDVRRLLAGVLSCAAMAACGGDGEPTDAGLPDVLAAGDLLDRVLSLSQVVSAEERETSQRGYRYFTIGFEQPVDHGDRGGARFTQYLTLIHIDEHAPVILGTTGYGNYYRDQPMEPTFLLTANQIIIEHRYFLPSRPDPTDWSFLSVVQSAADHHEVAVAFRRIYDGPSISTGGSKGGMASIYHRHLYPDDVAGTVAYVAPHNRTSGDTRYDAWFDEVLPAGCLQRVRDAQVEFLKNRRQAMVEGAIEQAGSDGIEYTRVTVPAAVESAIASIEWSFFQYTGVGACDSIPTEETPDEEAWEWLAAVSGPDGLSDESLAFFEPYYYQSYAELGYPSTPQPHIEPLLEFGPEDYEGTNPPVIPPYQPAAVKAAADWVREEAEDILFVYGEYDPWTAGAFDLGSNDGVISFTVPQGNHNIGIGDLAGADHAASLDLLEDWTGVAPSLAPLRALWRLSRPREPRLPIHALQMAAGPRR